MYFNVKTETPENHAFIHTGLLDNGAPFVVAVFADWCSHCTRLTTPQPGQSKSQWAMFLENQGNKYPVVDMNYDSYMQVKKNTGCDLGRMLNASVQSFPFVAIAQKDVIQNKISVHVYDGAYPMTADSIIEFLNNKE